MIDPVDSSQLIGVIKGRDGEPDEQVYMKDLLRDYVERKLNFKYPKPWIVQQCDPYSNVAPQSLRAYLYTGFNAKSIVEWLPHSFKILDVDSDGYQFKHRFKLWQHSIWLFSSYKKAVEQGDDILFEADIIDGRGSVSVSLYHPVYPDTLLVQTPVGLMGYGSPEWKTRWHKTAEYDL